MQRRVLERYIRLPVEVSYNMRGSGATGKDYADIEFPSGKIRGTFNKVDKSDFSVTTTEGRSYRFRYSCIRDVRFIKRLCGADK